MTVEKFVGGNSLRLLKNGEEYFPALLAAIDSAVHEIYVETYIFENDATGALVGDALMRAASRGVSVHLMLDGFGSRNFPKDIVGQFELAGIKVLYFGPKISPWTLRRSRLRRLHRKLAVIDAEKAFVGGINILDDCNSLGRPFDKIPPRYDYAMEIRGLLLAEIHANVRRFWALRARMHFHARWRENHSRLHVGEAGNQSAAFVVRDNLRHRRDIELSYLNAINRAQKEIIIANAYFFPGLSFRHALIDAAGRGVRVVLLLQGRVEYALLHYASRALYGNFLDAGIEIYEYHRSFMHAKVAVVDNHWATVGSSNIDPFSLLLAREANVMAKDLVFAEELRKSLMQSIELDSKRLLPDKWAKQPLMRRIVTWVSYGLVRLMTGMAGYGRDHEFR